MEKWMALPECKDNLQQAIVRDYYVGVAWCARENKMTPQQASALVTLMGILLDNCKVAFSLSRFPPSSFVRCCCATPTPARHLALS